MSDYSERLKKHLAYYKRDHLGITADGLWRGNQQPYAHILPASDYRLNVFETIREPFWEYFAANSDALALHTDFHHLNSSQAFAFNIFFPWMATEAQQGQLVRSLGLPERPIVRWAFEHIPDPAERTTFDFFAEFLGGSRMFVEVKLSEPHFGSVVPEERHRTKLTETYAPRLVGKAKPEKFDEAVFFLNYQLFRNVSHLNIEGGDRLLLVLPRANEFTWLQGEAFLSYLEPTARDAVQIIATEDLFAHLSVLTEAAAPTLETHLAELHRKYSIGLAPDLS